MDGVLVDSNIILRLVQPAHAQYPVAATAIAALRRRKADVCITAQNLVEFWAVATRPLAYNGLGMSPLVAAGELRNLRNLFRLLEGSPGVADAWVKLVSQYLVSGKQAHDAHLVAAMQVYGLRQLLTFNGDDFKRYPGITILHPEQTLSKSQ
jgi:predicted nucleic acid-binding protein